MITFRQQNVVQKQNTIIGKLSYENVETFKYQSVTIKNTLPEKLQHPQGLCSLAPGYMSLPRGCSVSDSFVTAIGEQMAFRSIFVPSVVTLQAVTVVL